ncbi:MAG: ankyrin repeat domain-containing protein [Gammaproteobacteria bacterium]|nr:ankyrin repeat domain-containing protein [Gammaproteobacteria bacterium]
MKADALVPAFAILAVTLHTPTVSAGPLHDAVGSGDRAAVERLIAPGVNIDEIDDDSGLTPLIVAALAGDEDMVVLLVDNGADPRGRDAKGFTALHAAAHMGRVDVVEVLLARDVQLDDQKNVSRMTPLHLAAERDHRAVAEILLEHGATLGLKTEAGHTPLFLASLKGHDDMVRLLRRHGADCTAIRSRKFRERCLNVTN